MIVSLLCHRTSHVGLFDSLIPKGEGKMCRQLKRERYNVCNYYMTVLL